MGAVPACCGSNTRVVTGMGICSACTPPQRFSIGCRVNVPLERTRTALQSSNHPAYHFSSAIMWPFEVLPMMDTALPYSVVVHVRGSFASGVPLQRSDAAG